MLRRAALVLVLLTLASPAAAGARTNRIVNGSPTTAGALPYVAGVLIAVKGVGDDDWDDLCGGSLIAARWVVTAAHCLVTDPVDVAHSYVVLGATDLDAATPDQKFSIADGFYPGQYETSGGGYDLGLIELKRPAPGPQVRLPRPSDTDLLAGGRPALVAGWGLTEDREDGGTLSTAQLRAVELNVYSDTDCESAFRTYGRNGLDFSTEVCALAPNRDSCSGDSGGPLVTDDGTGLPALIGAVSFGISGDASRGQRSCNEGPPGVYARLASNPLNGFIRAKVPQVEIDPNVKVPVPGETITLKAAPSAPGRSGPFGGYDTLAWDLDGDGNYAEAVGKRTATVPAAAFGATAVSVRATDAAGDNEVRTIRLVSQDKSALAFARRSARVRRGRTVALKVTRVGVGAGSAKVRVSGHGVRPSPARVSVTGSEPSVTVRLRASRSASRKVRVRLSSFGGDAVAGTRTKLTLKTR